MINIQWPRITLYFAFSILLASCSVSKQISKTAQTDIFSNKELSTAHIGISIFDPATGNYLYNHQGDKYFIPASNTKIPTCYAAMKYLGDSLAGWFVKETAESLYIKPNGDPTFLHPDFKQQKLFDLLLNTKKQVSIELIKKPAFNELGHGWTWSDYAASYMPERSVLPIYGNIVRFELKQNAIEITPKYFNSNYWFLKPQADKNVRIWRHIYSNDFYSEPASSVFKSTEIPFTGVPNVNLEDLLLMDTIKSIRNNYSHNYHGSSNNIAYQKYYTQATDSLLKIMMHRSDNFFAEQTLLMVSTEILGYLSDAKVIDTILKTDFKDLPQKPKWVDGSGLSRYNLFTPQDFVAILNKMKNEFGMDRVKTIFPTGGKGTLSSFYKDDSGFIFAKTGTLSNNVALSGFLYTKHGKLLIFSVQVNNHMTSATEVRKAVEKFLQGIRSKY
jgi:serine-type D-Ala-D-Ala carboxypeptidase/endopeptidase (penicillin-binding protein 4)